MNDSLLFLPDMVFGASYFLCGANHAAVIHIRLSAQGKELGAFAFLMIAFLWPISITLWAASCVVLRRRLPAPFIRDVRPNGLTTEKTRDEMRRDWESRLAFWYAEGQRAEAENDQALKWMVADNLSFLLDTKPESPVKVSEKKQAPHPYVKPVRLDASTPGARLMSPISTPMSIWAPHGERWRQLNAEIERKGKALLAGDVGFCNICARDRERGNLMMEGVCRECSEQQGLS